MALKGAHMKEIRQFGLFAYATRQEAIEIAEVTKTDVAEVIIDFKPVAYIILPIAVIEMLCNK